MFDTFESDQTRKESVMGRSVSTPVDAIVEYYDVSEFGHAWDEEKDCVDFDTYDTFQAECDWDSFKGGILEEVKRHFPSMSECEKWLGREDLAIAENGHAYFGVSEYCGVAAVWIVAKDDGDPNHIQLAESWVNKISKKFHRYFGQMKRIGVFSNGEAVYERKVA